jgi:HK97 family phage portal protein
VRKISADVASLKLQPYQHEPDGGKIPAKSHWSYPLVYKTPDGIRTAIGFWATIIQHAISWGNGFAEIEWDYGGRGLALHLLCPDRMQVRLERDRLIYEWFGSEDRPPKRLRPDQVLHIPNPMSYDGIIGLGVVAAARESLGLALAGELSMAAFYGNSAKPGGVVTHPAGVDLSEQGKKNVREYFDAVHTGPTNNGRVAHLFGGAAYAATTLPPPDEAYLKSREFQLQEIARWLNTPPTTVGDYSRATFSNVEQCNLDYQNTTLRPWAEFICAECDLKLLDHEERDKYFFRADYHQLLKADQASRAAFYASGLQWGWLNKNEVRAMEDRASMGEQGDVFTAPSNMITGQQIVLQTQQPPPEPTQEKGPTETPPSVNPAAASIRALVVEEISRLLRREAKIVCRAAKKPAFRQFVADHATTFAETIREHLAPSIEAYRAVGATIDLEALALRWCESTTELLDGIEQVCTIDQLPQAVEDAMTLLLGRAETLLTENHL